MSAHIKAAAQDRFSRRRVLRAFGVAGAGLWALPATDASSQPASSATPKAGGSVTLSHPGTIRTLDPTKQNSADEDLISYNVYETLTWWNYDGAVQPRLARSWDKSADLKTWTFHLRPDVKFHHGKSLTAQDVKFTIERLQDPKTGSDFRSDVTMVQSVEVLDPLTVRFHLSIPYSELDSVLSIRACSIVPADKVDSLSTSAFGTGPFLVKEFVQADHTTLSKNANYWQPKLPYLDTVVVKDIPESATQLIALKTGEIDIFWQVPFELVDQLKSTAGIGMVEAATNFWDPLIMNCKKAPFTNPKVRKAVRLSLDKDTVIRVALKGHGQKVILPLLPTDPVYPSQVKDLQQDYPQAKKLLAEAGFPQGFTTPMYIGTGRPARERLAELIVDMLKPANIRCNIQRMPIDKFFADVEGNGEFYCDGFAADPGADMHLYPVFHSGGSFDVSHWDNPQADALLDEARRTPSASQRREIYGRFAELQNEEGPAWIPWVQNIVIAHRNRVQGLRAWHDYRVWLGETWIA